MAKKPHQRDQAKYRLRMAKEKAIKKEIKVIEKVGRINIPKTKIEYMIKKQYSIKDMAKECQSSVSTIYNRLKTYNIKREKTCQ
jgi:hypothetical protein